MSKPRNGPTWDGEVYFEKEDIVELEEECLADMDEEVSRCIGYFDRYEGRMRELEYDFRKGGMMIGSRSECSEVGRWFRNDHCPAVVQRVRDSRRKDEERERNSRDINHSIQVAAELRGKCEAFNEQQLYVCKERTLDGGYFAWIFRENIECFNEEECVEAFNVYQGICSREEEEYIEKERERIERQGEYDAWASGSSGEDNGGKSEEGNQEGEMDGESPIEEAAEELEEEVDKLKSLFDF